MSTFESVGLPTSQIVAKDIITASSRGKKGQEGLPNAPEETEGTERPSLLQSDWIVFKILMPSVHSFPKYSNNYSSYSPTKWQSHFKLSASAPMAGVLAFK